MEKIYGTLDKPGTIPRTMKLQFTKEKKWQITKKKETYMKKPW